MIQKDTAATDPAANPVALAKLTVSRLQQVGAVLPDGALEIIESALIGARVRSITEVKLEADLLLDAMESQAERRFDTLVRCAVGAALKSLGLSTVTISPKTMTALVAENTIDVTLADDGSLVYTLEGRNVG